MPSGLRLVRIERLAIVVLALVVLLGARLFQLQVIRHTHYRERQLRQATEKREIPVRRGRILDRKGRPLAFDVVAYDVSLLKNRVRSRDLQILETILDLKPSEVQRRLKTNGSFVRLVSKVTLSPKAVKRLGTLPGVCLDRHNSRQYPFETLASQYIGFTDAENKGVEGVEKTFDEILRGQPGEVIQLCDENGQPIGQHVVREPRDGSDVVLSLDVDLQRIADDELRKAILKTQARGGSVVILDPQTGDLLACANGPAPASRSATYRPEEWRNRAVYDLFEPGSTLKPITASAALRHGIVQLDTYIYAERGAKRFGRDCVIRDARRSGYAWLSFAEAFARSSNIVFAKLARDLSSDHLYEELRAFGFGSRSGIQLLAEPSGQLALPREWSGRTRLTLGYGQEISVTAVQLAGLYATIANGGTLRQPRVALRLEQDGIPIQHYPARQVRQVLDQELASALQRLCEITVREGSGSAASVEGMAVAGKTGTAEKAAGGRYVSSYVASFAGFAPAEDPQVVCLVVLDEPSGQYHWGGKSAAPTFRQVMEGILRSTDALQPGPQRVQVVRAGDLDDDATGLDAPLRLAMLRDGSMPDLRGLRLRTASRWLHRLGVVPAAEGMGVVTAQWPPPGENVNQGGVARLLCKPVRAPSMASSIPIR